MECRELLRYWPFPLFVAVVSPIVLPAIIDVSEPTATVVAGMMQAAATAAVGAVAYRGLVVPIAAQREADRRQVANILIADLSQIAEDSRVVVDLLERDRAWSETGQIVPGYRIRFNRSDRRLLAVEAKLGVLPVETIAAVSEVYAKLVTAAQIEEFDKSFDDNRQAMRNAAWILAWEQFFNLANLADTALVALLKFANDE